MRRRLPATTAAAAAMAVVLAACSSAGPADEVTAAPVTDEASPSAVATATPTPTTTPTPAPVELTEAELADLQVNEVGRVLVSEWHRIGTDTDDDYQNTLATFREQLQELYDRGFRPVTQAEYAAGTFPIPAGTSPVLLTFDDSSPNHLRWADDGQTPHPDSVVGILEDFAASHDDWRATAVFALNWPPFGDQDDAAIEAKLSYLVDNGFELSNHTISHEYLDRVDDATVQAELAGIVANVTALVPDAEIPSLTLPFGLHPADAELEVAGSSDGTTYEHDLVYEVGWMPDHAPHHVEYDARSIMRVPAHGPWSDTDLDWWDWLDWLEDEPLRAFVSDGDPATVTYPIGFEEVADVRGDVTVRTYDRDA